MTPGAVFMPIGNTFGNIRWPVRIGPHTVRRYRQAIEDRPFPPPDSLSVGPVMLGDDKG
jgi:hypothetical protein